MSDFDQAWRAARPAEPVTPDGAEKRLQRISDALEENEAVLTQAADEEMDAQGALDEAEIRWRLSPECPQAGVVDGVRTTVAYVDAWVRDRTAAERTRLRLATQVRRAAEAQRRRLEHQLRAAQSVNKSVTEVYRGSGRWLKVMSSSTAWNSTLKPGRPPQRRKGLSQGTGLARDPAKRLGANARATRRAADRERMAKTLRPGSGTGFSPAVKRAVRLRAGYRCENCGLWLGEHGGQVHHRLNRKMGGRGNGSVVNTVVAASLLCGTPFTGCHGLATRLDAAMKANGFVLTENQNPADVPLNVLTAGGGRVLKWPTPEGDYSDVPPAERAVAA